MPWLLVNPGSPQAWAIRLKPGPNSFGRSAASDFQLDHPSVSSAHCQIIVGNANVLLKDLGSTNGTFVNRSPVHEAILEPGQTLHFGDLELTFHSDAPETQPRPAAPVGPVIHTAERPPPITARIPVPASALPDSGLILAADSHFCKIHPKAPARFVCPQCQRYFCELCVNPRGGQNFCRACGVECAPVEIRYECPPPPKGFYARLPAAFLFPFRGSGLLVLIFATCLLALIQAGGGMGNFGIRSGPGPGFRGGLSFGWWGLMARAIVLGYLFAYMQNIIHATAIGEEEMPSLPDVTSLWEDILLPCLQLIGLSLISFTPAIAVGGWVIATGQESSGPVLTAAFVLGCLYFPMAFLAVAMLDSVAAANPLHVIPSILRVPREYLVVLIALAGVFGIRALGDFALVKLFPKGLITHSTARLFGMFAAEAFWSLASLYLLTVGMRILGLLYLTRKDKLTW